jgi:hypothetical protein
VSACRLRISQPTLHPRSMQVWLNDFEVTSFLGELSLSFQRDSVTTATLVIMPDRIEIDAQTLANLEAWVKINEARP